LPIHRPELFVWQVALIFGFILPREEVTAQITAKDLVGTWTIVFLTLQQDGKKADFYGPNPLGQSHDASKRFVSNVVEPLNDLTYES
jgi:hypothetical protein